MRILFKTPISPGWRLSWRKMATSEQLPSILKLLDRARRPKVSLSQVEAGLVEVIRRHERARWLEKNRAALDAYNEHVDQHGVFSDGLRVF